MCVQYPEFHISKKSNLQQTPQANLEISMNNCKKSVQRNEDLCNLGNINIQCNAI